jgi:hypothetical protein
MSTKGNVKRAEKRGDGLLGTRVLRLDARHDGAALGACEPLWH